jgi:hypothetical protein
MSYLRLPKKNTSRKSKLTPKELATKRKEPYIKVLNTHVNANNPHFGFFEFDWNDYFIEMLQSHGYTGKSEEQIVEAWYVDICKAVLAEQGQSTDDVIAGTMNVTPIAKK